MCTTKAIHCLDQLVNGSAPPVFSSTIFLRYNHDISYLSNILASLRAQTEPHLALCFGPCVTAGCTAKKKFPSSTSSVVICQQYLHLLCFYLSFSRPDLEPPVPFADIFFLEFFESAFHDFAIMAFAHKS